MCKVFGRFVMNYARIARPLTQLIGTTAPLHVPHPTAAQ